MNILITGGNNRSEVITALRFYGVSINLCENSGLTADLRPGDKAALASTIATLHKALNPQDKRGPQVQINILADGESARRALANLGVISDAGEVIDVEAQDAGQGGES
jgi:hypothetical protein